MSILTNPCAKRSASPSSLATSQASLSQSSGTNLQQNQIQQQHYPYIPSHPYATSNPTFSSHEQPSGLHHSNSISSSTHHPRIHTPNSSVRPSTAGNVRSVDDKPGTIIKSVQINAETPCYQVIPISMKKYNISGDWRDYDLFICYEGDERCMGFYERPLALFRQYEREGNFLASSRLI